MTSVESKNNYTYFINNQTFDYIDLVSKKSISLTEFINIANFAIEQAIFNINVDNTIRLIDELLNSSISLENNGNQSLINQYLDILGLHKNRLIKGGYINNEKRSILC